MRRNLLIMAVLATLPACTGIYAKGDVGYAQFSLSGDVALSPTSGSANLDLFRVDVEDDLGLGDAEGTPYGKLDVGLGLFSVSVTGFEYDGSGTGRLTRNFGGIPIGSDVRSEARILNLKGALLFELIDIGGLKLSPGIGVDYFDMDVTVTSTSASEEVEAIAPVPMLFAKGELDIGPASLTVEGGYSSANLEDAEGTFWDLEGILRIHPIKNLHFFAGYRYISVDAEGDADGQPFDANLSLAGWIVGGGFRF